VKLGHSVRSVADSLDLAEEDLDTATALLDARPILGDAALGEHVAELARTRWRTTGRRRLAELAQRTNARHARHDDIAFAVEPDLKEGAGGLRDAQTLRWIALAGVPIDLDDARLAAAVDTLAAARNALHLTTGRAANRLFLDDLDDVARHLGHADRDGLMADVSSAAREISWALEEVLYDLEPHPAIRLEDAIVRWDHGRAQLRPEVRRPNAATAVHLAVVAAANGVRISPDSLERMGAATVDGDRWPPALREAFVDLLACGRDAIPVIEALDHGGLWTTLLPEWAPTRSRPQHNPYHAFTVDRHLLETVAVAATLPTRRPELLLLAALFHDLGKAYPGDHSEVGAELARRVGRRIGLPDDDLDTLEILVRHHLLLPDTATRRDLDDRATLEAVAAIVGRSDRLDLLAQLALADGTATGATAWSSWKAGLVAELARRVHGLLAGVAVDEVVSPSAFSDDALALAGGAVDEVAIDAADGHLTIAAPDQPGLFSRITGAVALHGLDVRDARIGTVEGTAIDELRVEPTHGGDIDWEAVADDIRAAIAGSLALSARLSQRAEAYVRRPVPHTLAPEIRIFDGTDEHAAIVEVVGPDSLGLLYRLAAALTELRLDITRAMVTTIGNDVVDVFYVRDPGTFGIRTERSRRELRLALSHALGVATPAS
jgi:[protein-PII] uridylyltransferase